MSELRSVQHLTTEEEVVEQVSRLQRLENDLEAEHGRFVALSQLSCDAVARFDAVDGAVANRLRRQLDSVTQRWDNIVTRIEELTQTVDQYR